MVWSFRLFCGGSTGDRERGRGVPDELAVLVAGVRFGERDATANPQDAPPDLDPVTGS